MLGIDIDNWLISLTAVCNVCKVNVSRGGGSTAKYKPTNLIKHIQQHHAKEHAEFLQLHKTKGTGDSTAPQLTLVNALQRRKKVSDGKLESSGNDTEVLDYTVSDAQSWNALSQGTLFHYASIFPRPVYSLLLIQQQYWIGIGYQQINKAHALVWGLK